TKVRHFISIPNQIFAFFNDLVSRVSTINEKYGVVVDIDLEKFFDRVNHDKLIGLLCKKAADKRVLRLIRGYLESWVMERGLSSPTDEGTPQGGPLSPLLSNVTLHYVTHQDLTPNFTAFVNMP
ncbi:MAG: hypothetical protein HQK98_11580, partial [Nitrospirae bacterium]|nr:hypothetical protein [Nitrospirota bacterium]